MRNLGRPLGYLLILVAVPVAVQLSYLLSCQLGHSYNAWEFTASGATGLCFGLVIAGKAIMRARRGGRR